MIERTVRPLLPVDLSLTLGPMCRGRSDPTMRIVWYLGKPYGISSRPFGPSEPATEWHVLMPSDWLPLFPYRDGDDWSAIERRVLDWLATGGG